MNVTIKSICTAMLCALSVFTMAQDKSLTLEDLIPGGRTAARFTPATLRQPQWCGDTYLYAKGDSVWYGMPGKPEQIAFTLATLNGALSAFGRETVSTLPFFTLPVDTEPVVVFTSRQHRLHYDYRANKITAGYTLPAKGSNYDYAPGSERIAFTEGNNLRILSADNQVTTVTQENDEGIVCGQSVHQNEFGIRKGTYWSPSGSLLAFYRMDETMVTAYPLVTIDARCAESVPHRYPMAGMKSHEVTVGVYHTATGQTVWLKTGLPKEKYLTNIAWSPDEQSIYIAELNRDQNELSMVRYSAVTGEQEALLFTEKSDRYVEPRQPILFVPNQPDRFIWQSERDGYNHLYLYDTSGILIKQLTSGPWVVQQIAGFDAKGEQLFFTATAPHPSGTQTVGSALETYAWKVSLKSGKRSCFSTRTGVHSVDVSPSGQYAIDVFTAPDVPRDIAIIRTKDGQEITSLLKAKDPYAGYPMPEITTGTVKAGDGITDLHYRLIKPLGMDASKKYPTVVYVYGGPHSQQVTGGWQYGTRGWEIYMAEKGYVVFVLDNRGTANRGRDFEQIIHRQLGVAEMADQMQGIHFLKSLPYVDATRIGVHGWSYGGFMTVNLMLSHPDVFKAGVAGGPVIDWKYYEIMYGERYMDRPQDNPEGYAQANLNAKAGNLRGRLLIIHGTVDPVVVWQHSLSFLKACIDARTYPDYFVYPGHEHNVAGKDRVHLHEKITRYFDEHL